MSYRAAARIEHQIQFAINERRVVRMKQSADRRSSPMPSS
jgi:hypothetical protein